MNLQRWTWVASVVAAIVLGSAPVLAASINVALGTGGTFIIGQSYNETRGVDITVVGPKNLHVRLMRLVGLRVYGPSATLGARIYDSSCAIIGSGVATIPGTPGGSTSSVTIPISATLAAGKSYRLTIDVSTAGPYGQSSGDFFLPSHFPYIEPSHNMRINSAWDGPVGACPTIPNFAVPRITVFVDPLFAGTPGSSDCRGQSEAALASQFGALPIAAIALGYPDVRGLEFAIGTYCQQSPSWPRLIR